MNTTVLAETAVDSVSTVPSYPEPLSEVTVTATISGDDITAVRVYVQECERGFACYTKNFHDMEENADGDWEVTADLEDDSGRVDYITYWFYVTVEGSDEEIVLSEDSSGEKMEVDLDVSGGSNGDDGGSSSNGSPGFELITLLVAVGIGFIILRRKRL